MTLATADRIAMVVREVLGAAGLEDEVAQRLYRYTTRHLPIEGAPAGSPIIPPMYTARVAEALGSSADEAARLAAVSCFYFASADIADDCADGDERVAPGVDINDTCRMVFLYQLAALELPAPADARARLLRLLVDCGLEMADGQERDLLGTDALEAADPVGIALDKSGAELAACIAAPAVLRGVESEPYLRFGQAFGGLIQVTTDYLDLFLDPYSDDWAAAKPSLPIRAGLSHRRHGAEVAMSLAGSRTLEARKATGLWHLMQADVGTTLAAVRDRLGAEMRDAEAQVHCGALLEGFRLEVEGWVDEVVEALEILRGDPAPIAASPAHELATSLRRARAFLARDRQFAETVDAYLGVAGGEVLARGTFFGRAMACLALGLDSAAVAKAAELEAARGAALEEASGRYFPRSPRTPTSADCAGLALQLGADTRALRKAATQVEDDVGVAAQALLGLRAVGRTHAAQARALAVAAVDGPPSRYDEVARDYLLVRALRPYRDAAEVEATLRVIGERLSTRRDLAGRFGDALETAMAATALAGLGELPAASTVVRALVDLQADDGGYPACVFYRPLSDGAGEGYASRVVTTAFVLGALDLIGETTLG